MDRQDAEEAVVSVPARVDGEGRLRGYVRLAAVGDELAGGVPHAWPALLARAVAADHDVSFHGAAHPDAGIGDVLRHQLPDAVAHRPHVVLLAAGGYDVRRRSWDVDAFRRELLTACAALCEHGALLVVTRLALQAGPAGRVAAANAALDEAHRRFGGTVLDLPGHPGAEDPEFWTVPGVDLSALGHAALLEEAAELLGRHGLRVVTDLGSGLRTPHHVDPMTSVTDYEQAGIPPRSPSGPTRKGESS